MRVCASLVAGVLVVAGCAGAGSSEPRLVPAPVTSVAGPAPSQLRDAGPLLDEPPEFDEHRPPPPTIAPPSEEPEKPAPCPGGPERFDAASEEVPEALVQRLSFVAASPQWGAVDRSISVWVEGYGEVFADHPDTPLLPASNQKIHTALGAATLLHPDERFTTRVHRVGDALVIEAGGDPTLTTAGPHSLLALAGQVADGDPAPVERIVVDASAFEAATTAPGWLDYQMPAYVGPMSAFMVDDNRYRTDRAFVADPVTANGVRFAELLRFVGVEVGDEVLTGTHDGTGTLVAELASAPVHELVDAMMTDSDNEIAEALLRRIGDGSTTEGTARIDDLLDDWCLDLRGESGDGSGLGRASWRSAREWRRLLQMAAQQPWGAELRESMAVAGRTGTLRDRFVGTVAESRVEAKTGSIIGGRSLSGYTTTADGREVVFSVVVNGDPDETHVARDAIDGLVLAIVSPLDDG